MKKIFLFLSIAVFACGSASAEAKKLAQNNDLADYEVVITDCGKSVYIPRGNYSGDFYDRLITILDEELCK